MKKEEDKKGELERALIKKALGYTTEETVEEYSQTPEGEIRLSKKKVTKKSVPPDMTALKILLDQTQPSIASMSDAELEEEKIRLINLLKENENS